MAAYAALVSLTHIIDQIQNHPRPPITLDKSQVEFLIEKVTFWQEVLEGCYSNGGSKDVDALEGRVAYAAYAAEDIIDSHIVDRIQAGSSSSVVFHRNLQKVIDDIEPIKIEVEEIKDKTVVVHDQVHISSIWASSFRSPYNMTMVGFDDVKIEIMDKLTGQPSSRQIIPIVGMGGIGKTTLARNIYLDPLVKCHFDMLAWVTISQEYNAKRIILEVLLCLRTIGSSDSLSRMSEDELGEKLYKSLSGRRYLIIMDDIWSIEAWDKVKFFFPYDNNGSRILITTRLSYLAFQLTSSHGLVLNFLDKDKSWNLLCKIIFGEQDCPLELVEIGKKIAENCKGLPLSIVVIGGLLAKSKQTHEYWEYVSVNLNSIVNLDDNERCLKILQTSYNWLPVHLKPCFLYMGVFREDSVTRVSELIELWVAEGFLKPIRGKSLEMVAEEYLNELIDRNLVLIDKRSSNGKIKSCNMHDLLRDLCLREAQTDNFLYVTRQHNFDIPHGIENQRRVGIHAGTRPQVIDALQSASLARSLICDAHFQEVLPLHNFKLLRVLRALIWINQKSYFEKRDNRYRVKAVLQLVNLRFLAIQADWGWLSRIPSSIFLLWNLQTLIVKGNYQVYAPSEIWKMSQLRHVKFDELYLPNPLISSHMDDKEDNYILENLQTLSRIRDFKCCKEVVKRIPNIKKLKIFYWGIEGWSRYCLNNLDFLHKLEFLGCYFHAHAMRNNPELVQNLAFPRSLKELTLEGCHFNWEDVTTKIGSLPFLEVLKLKFKSFIGTEWKTVGNQFCCLKFLLLKSCRELECWNTESMHFPLLEHVVLRDLSHLKEVPSEIGEIPTLRSLKLFRCPDSANMSARRILEEQEELGNLGLIVQVNQLYC